MDLDENPGCVVAIFAGFAFISIIMLSWDDGAQRLFGVVGLLFFGGMGLGFTVGHYLTTQPEPPHNGRVTLPDGTRTQAFVIPGSPGRQRAGAIGMAIASLGCLLVFFNPEVLGPRYVGYQWVFGLIALLTPIWLVSVVRAWRQREAFIALTPQGILIRGVGAGTFAPWDSITGVGIAEQWRSRSLGMNATSPHAIVHFGSARLMGRSDAMFSHYDAVAHVTGYALNEEDVVHLASHYLTSPDERPKLGIELPDAPAHSTEAG